MIKVLIADDHKLVRNGLKMLLEQTAADIEVVGEAATGKEVLTFLENNQADLTLMDFEMPEMNGVEATRHIKVRFSGVKVLMLTMADNEKKVKEAIEAGAQGYVLKSAGGKELLHAIHMVAGGEEYFSVELTKMLLEKVHTSTSSSGNLPASSQALPADISPRELEVLRLIAKGHTNQQIGDILFTSKRTVESHRQNLLEKTGANNTATLIRYAVQHGLVE